VVAIDLRIFERNRGTNRRYFQVGIRHRGVHFPAAVENAELEPEERELGGERGEQAAAAAGRRERKERRTRGGELGLGDEERGL